MFSDNKIKDGKLQDLEKYLDAIASSVPQSNAVIKSSEATKDIPSDLVQTTIVASASSDSLVNDSNPKDFMSKNGALFGNREDPEVKSILDKLSVQQDRLAKYIAFDEVYQNVPLIKKMMKVWLSNIFQKNPVSGKSLLIQDSSNNDVNVLEQDYESKKETSRSFIDATLDYFSLTEKIKYHIVPMELYYGDSFVEVMDLTNLPTGLTVTGKGTAKTLYLAETSLDPVIKQKRAPNFTREIKNRNDELSLAEDISDYLFEDDTTIFTETKLQNLNKEPIDFKINLEEKKSNFDTDEQYLDYVVSEGEKISVLKPVLKKAREKFENSKTKSNIKKLQEEIDQKINDGTIPNQLDFTKVAIFIHHPRNILILQTEYGSVLGYVEIQDAQIDAYSGNSVAKQIAAAIGKTNSSNITKVDNYDTTVADIVDKLVEKLVKKAANSLGITDDKIKPEELINTLSPEVFNTLRRLVLETRKQNNKTTIFKKYKVRFIPIQNMFHFTIGSTDNYPYGQSFIEPLLLQSKLYMIYQLGNLVSKLSRAAPIRKWTVDVGSTQMQSKFVQEVKRDLYNHRVTVDNMLSFKSIPNILSEYKDLFILSKGGQKSVDVEVQSLGDSSLKTQDLEDCRKELLGLSGIPSSYLGFSDTVELQSQLVKF